mmetsp:Transcript_20313/g.77783  ORF Transcript_20313/g.77783 Transcript_20313/m.77783 type:complete len:833 (-) Transcript_20313:63-2561(-)|eukprot:CAMPEP_0114615896 /NCGR_PEP_ID=MMETSP0168-20121206/6407_1 /TAXON_ID=95228 ORGANISM="Vannella sp., Strain DIVA3 517/6/12" /NCGR_SAMPLE_ID=MMETSP0168 /ASSEMBLY_ACC=CAM_ASM_000044 /LENGTH=832 /DNA_ID=CAMNT_0001826993 /DNA_START=91 /DNA_END=2589 /DNA_ORIENTATION=+
MPDPANSAAPPVKQAEPGAAVQVLRDLGKVLKDNLFVQHVLAVPFVMLFTYYLGWFLTWGSLIAVTVMYSVRRVERKKVQLYEHFESKGKECTTYSTAQQCEWLNLLLRKYWLTCVPKLVEPHLKRVQDLLEQNKPAFLYSLSVSEFHLGHRAPRIDQLVTDVDMENHRYQLDLNLHIVPDFFMEIKIEPVRRVSVKIRVDNIKVQGTARLAFRFNDLFPDASVGSLSFMGDPLVEFSIKPMGSVDMLSMPMLYEWLDEMIKSQLKPLMVWPQKIQFTLGGAQIDDEHGSNEPITDITFIAPEEGKAPAGFLLLSRSAGGTLPADISRGSGGQERYLCYKRGTDKAPITGLCIIMPGSGEQPPANFGVIDETPAGDTASFNVGNGGPEMFLCYTRQPGDPITGLCVFNEEEGTMTNAEEHKLIELTTSGHIANVNKKTKGDRIMLGYKGGSPSIFGFNKPPVKVGKGTLHVFVDEGRDLKAMDVGGTSDPYCEVIVETPPPEDNPKKKPEREKKVTKVIDKTLTPVWKQSLALPATSRDIVTVNVYDKDVVGKDDLMGAVRFPLSTLVRGQPVDQWFALQNVSRGEIRLRITAADFGEEPVPGAHPELIPQLEISKKAKLAGHISTVGGGAKSIGHKTVGGTLGFGSKIVGGVGAGVSAVGEGVSAVGAGVFGGKREAAALPDTADVEQLAPGSDYVEISGHLEKLPTKSFIISQGFKRRWFVLKSDKLAYYRGHKDKNMLGSIGLKSAELQLVKNEKNVFTISTATKTLTLRAETHASLVSWWQAILTHIKLTKENSRFKTIEDHPVVADEDEDLTEMSAEEPSEKDKKKK